MNEKGKTENLNSDEENEKLSNLPEENKIKKTKEKAPLYDNLKEDGFPKEELGLNGGVTAPSDSVVSSVFSAKSSILEKPDPNELYTKYKGSDPNKESWILRNANFVPSNSPVAGSVIATLGYSGISGTTGISGYSGLTGYSDILNQKSLTIETRPHQIQISNADEIYKLRRRLDDLTVQLEKSHEENEENKKIRKEANGVIGELNKKIELGNLLRQVNEAACEKLNNDEDFLKNFTNANSHDTFVLSIDIRRSTELMLKSNNPLLYARFLFELSEKLSIIIKNNYGIYDKFTGDGILAFFPEFFSGKEAGVLAVKAALECQELFSEFYKAYRNIFISVLLDTGLGIGIDYGQAYLVNINGSYTVIGHPVVYACRLSGAKPGKTLLNQAAFYKINQQGSQYFLFSEDSLEIKHEGIILAYNVASNGSAIMIQPPLWSNQNNSEKLDEGIKSTS